MLTVDLYCKKDAPSHAIAAAKRLLIAAFDKSPSRAMAAKTITIYAEDGLQSWTFLIRWLEDGQPTSYLTLRLNQLKRFLFGDNS